MRRGHSQITDIGHGSWEGESVIVECFREGLTVIYEKELDRFLDEHPQGFFFGFSKTGDVEIQTLRDVIRILAIEGVVDLSHFWKNSRWGQVSHFNISGDACWFTSPTWRAIPRR